MSNFNKPSTFLINGTVTKAETLTSLRGNEYFVFLVKTRAGKTFEMSLFGEGMAYAEELVIGAKVSISGEPDSREYQNKTGKTRYDSSFKVVGVEHYTEGGKEKAVSVKDASDADLSFIPF